MQKYDIFKILLCFLVHMFHTLVKTNLSSPDAIVVYCDVNDYFYYINAQYVLPYYPVFPWHICVFSILH